MKTCLSLLPHAEEMKAAAQVYVAFFFSHRSTGCLFFNVLLYSNLFVKSEPFHVILMYCGVLTSFEASGRDVDALIIKQVCKAFLTT